MAVGSKKKKKPASNPARGVTTTSIQSKSKVESVKDSESADVSGAVTPETTSTSVVSETVGPSTEESQRELHELSPEDLEAQLEASELQQFIETHAARVRRDTSRQVSRLQTEKRLLRGQAESLSVRDWLPEELMQQILDLTLADLDHERQYAKKPSLPAGDDLIAKVWNHRLILLELGIPLSRANEVIETTLQHPPEEGPTGQTWGLVDAWDWLALHCDSEELLEYDAQRKRTTRSSQDGNDTSLDPNDESTTERPSKQDSSFSRAENGSAGSSTNLSEVDVSDLESDLEPDELLSVYMRTKAKLYEINPAAGATQARRNVKGARKHPTANHIASNGERRLQQKLKKIESDLLFDQDEADARWASQSASLAQETAQRRKLQLPNSAHSADHTRSPSPARSGVQSENVTDDAETLGNEVLKDGDNLDDVDILGGVFNALPGVSESGSEGVENGASKVTIRDFGRAPGMAPRRILEETCRSRDSRCNIVYKQVSPTTYACRHSVTIDWTKEQDVIESSYIPSIDLKSRPNRFTFTMIREATSDAAQSEAFVSTAALFLIFSGSPKDEKCHLRLPPAYRDLWDEFLSLKRDQIDAVDRGTVRELRSMVEKHTQPEDDQDDEVVFNASSRRLNGVASGATTPSSRPHTPKLGLPNMSQSLKDIWSRKTTTPAYQRMLPQRQSLPMFHAKAAALETIQRNQVTIVVGDTGSGKSTQVPQFLLEHELSNGRPCKIYCTEPRRISAISLAQRVSEELGEQKGDLGTARSLVGYAIRLESHAVSQTRLVYATVGIVLRMLENADGLSEITHLILDEVHERSIDTDFLLIILQSLIVQRPDLKVVLMSATVDAKKFSQYLDDAPIIEVPGRTFPVEARFLEDAIELTGYTNEGTIAEVVTEDDSDRQEQPSGAHELAGYSKQTRNTLAKYDEYKIDHALIVQLLESVAYQVEYQRFSQAILIFVPGIQEIRQLNDMLVGHPSFSHGWRIHALHSTFSSDDQQAAFEIPPTGTRKIVIATNIAETGITIPDVTCVIDTGKHREMRFDERRQMSRLTQSFIARTNAKQRRGRAGRVQEGICFHLFTRQRFNEVMAEQQTPEMLRLSLQDLVMRVKICKLGDIETALSQALDPPSSKNIRRAIDALIEVGALTDSEQLTPLGRQLAKMPLDAQLGKLLLFGAIFGCLDFALTVAATMSSKSPFLSPMHAKKQVDSVRLGFKRGDSDLLTVYNAYSSWRKVCTTPGLSEYQFCNKNFLSPQNLANIEDLKGQLLTSLIDAGFVSLGPIEQSALMRVRPGSRQRNFVTLPGKYCRADEKDLVGSSVVAWSFYPKILKQDGKGWRNIANSQSLGLHPTSVNKHGISPTVKFLSFYSIMQSSSRFTNAQETTPVSDFALVLLAGDAVFHMYAGVIVIDGNRLRLKVRNWKIMIALKTLRVKVKEALERQFKNPGRDLGDRQRRWMEVVEKIFEQRKG